MRSNKKGKEEAAVKPVGPAESMEELAGLVFDVPCANCGGRCSPCPTWQIHPILSTATNAERAHG